MSAASSHNGPKPRHLAVIMDGNGRWAQARGLPRTAGHRAGAKATRRTVEYCGRAKIEALTLFAFSSENWLRPASEVSVLMDLFLRTLRRELNTLHENNVRLRFVGSRERFTDQLLQEMTAAEEKTRHNAGLQLTLAVGYGGRWDIVNAAQRLAARVEQGEISAAHIDMNLFADELSLAGLPEPDLLIRTGGEQRISNFLLWQMAYTELYFLDTLWPDFNDAALDEALAWFGGRERRFGDITAKAGAN